MAEGLYRKWVFPHFMTWLMRRPIFSRQRAELLEVATGHVLELGFGTGLNLPYYPSSIRSLTAIDSSRAMIEMARKRMGRTPFPLDLRQLEGERLSFHDASFDTAVSTWTLCSVSDVSKTLAEVFRVLRPGGRFLFIEHGLSPDANVRTWQYRLNPVQNRVGAGCHLTRDIPRLIQASGLTVERLEEFYQEGAPRALGYMYKGLARRPSTAEP